VIRRMGPARRGGQRVRAPWLAVIAICAAGLGCGPRAKQDGPQSAAGRLGPGIVARVGAIDVSGETVAEVAVEQRLDRARARELAIRDALFANEAAAGGLDRSGVSLGEDAALARRLLHELLTDAERKGDVTDDELREATARHWLELDRPEGFRTIHAVVRLDAKADAARRQRAGEIAGALRLALAPVRETARSSRPPVMIAGSKPDDDPVLAPFRHAVDQVVHEGFEVTAEPLPPITADGRGLQMTPQSFDKDFARAAATLVERGDLSPVTFSAFGAHVILLLERTPPAVLPAKERRRIVREEVVTDRARAAQEKLLESLRERVAVDANADAALALVPLSP
jgi:PPIC-type PPIASE domain